MKDLQLQLTIDEDGLEGVHDLLGDVSLCVGQECIEESVTYVDSWFAALIEGLERLQTQPQFEVELLEEPSPLNFYRMADGFTITYKDRRVVFPSTEGFAADLAAAATSFLMKLRAHGIGLDSDNLRLIDGYVRTSTKP